jgi:hypothetical protein
MCFQKYWYRSKVFAWRKNAAPVMEAMAGTGGAVSGTGSMQTLLNDSKILERISAICWISPALKRARYDTAHTGATVSQPGDRDGCFW